MKRLIKLFCIGLLILGGCSKQNDLATNQTTNQSVPQTTVEVTSKLPTTEVTTSLTTHEETTVTSNETVLTTTTTQITKNEYKPLTPISQLYVSGTKVVDSNGNTVNLRGVSTHGISWFPEYANKEVMKQARDEWGVNVFRVAMYTAEYNGYCESDDSNKQKLKNTIHEVVEAAIELDMYVVIDWHILNDRNPLKYKEAAKKFFEEMSMKYAEVPNVIYEICNEPNGGTSWEDIKQYANEIIPIIRKSSENALIIVGTPNWSQDVDIAAKSTLEFDNVLYALHFYAATHKNDLQNKLKIALNSGLPILVSEFGICEATGNGYVDEASANSWIQLLESNNVGYIMWNLSNKNESSSMIQANCLKKSNFSYNDLTQAGKWFVNLNGKSTPKNTTTSPITTTVSSPTITTKGDNTIELEKSVIVDLKL